MKTYMYGVRDCHTQDACLLRSCYGYYEYGDVVIVGGRRVLVVTPVVPDSVVVNDRRLAQLPVLSTM